MSILRRIILAAACSLVLGRASNAAQPRRDPAAAGPVSGTITLSARGIAAGAGYSWGDGTLRYGGHKYPFSVHGISIADVGFSRVSGRGRVYNLHRLQDFSGTYAAATGEATLGSGIGGQVLRNGHGVEIRVDQVTEGARLQGSADGIRLTLR
jgi:hypothetical protein